ncbi:caspase family protein [Leptolyngbya sp. UWPOB_LEPTO1]|uniref:caspase family protein n=1 Tax=Leptolyngbya sp. UWPOB_LEPTO1 TaxID=2815653 RepID=UPI00257D6A09|nr:caspase family protein [Leptolyngbya sp. UWPOB_LEPTO1]
MMRRFIPVLLASVTLTNSQALSQPSLFQASTCQRSNAQNFLVFGGGGGPSYNEIALEKNMLYFQRSLKELGYNPSVAPIYFANGNTGEKTVRYLDERGREQYKTHTIPNVQGASSIANLRTWLTEAAKEKSSTPLFFYFSGHGGHNRVNEDNSTLLMWRDRQLNVQNFTQMLDRLPQNKPFVTMMSQCYSGSFANLIYRGGDPNKGVALQTRCGFFATIKSRPSVGCTPEVNEADYRDYSSSFFAGLTGRDRVGRKVASADYNKDGRIAYSEAHAYAKVDKFTTDLPISTSEAWLQRQVSNPTMQEQILGQPIAPLAKIARPEQRFVIESLSKQFKFDPARSFRGNLQAMKPDLVKTAEDEAYLVRLSMELTNVAMERRVKTSKDAKAIATLNRLLRCESGSWGKP